MVRRWQQLPLDRARSMCSLVGGTAQMMVELTGCTDELPSLTPAATMDQLQVAAYDACAAGQQRTTLERLIDLRRHIG